MSEECEHIKNLDKLVFGQTLLFGFNIIFISIAVTKAWKNLGAQSDDDLVMRNVNDAEFLAKMVAL